jgi:hypothetical protein
MKDLNKMLINQDFAQSKPKSPVKRRLELVGNDLSWDFQTKRF